MTRRDLPSTESDAAGKSSKDGVSRGFSNKDATVDPKSSFCGVSGSARRYKRRVGMECRQQLEETKRGSSKVVMFEHTSNSYWIGSFDNHEGLK